MAFQHQNQNNYALDLPVEHAVLSDYRSQSYSYQPSIPLAPRPGPSSQATFPLANTNNVGPAWPPLPTSSAPASAPSSNNSNNKQPQQHCVSTSSRVVDPSTNNNSHSLLNLQPLLNGYSSTPSPTNTTTSTDKSSAAPATSSSAFQLRHLYAAIHRARTLQQRQRKLAQQQEQLQKEIQQHQRPPATASSVTAPTPQEIASFLSAIHSMTAQQSTNTNNLPITMTTESDYPPAPVELPSWMLKDAAVAAAASDIETSPVWSTLADDFSPSEQDPSPALSDGLTFDELLSSCDPSPLLADDMAYVAGSLAEVPLFGTFPSLPGQDADAKMITGKPADPSKTATVASAPAGPIGFNDFTLFPDTAPASAPHTQAHSPHAAAPLHLAFGTSTPPGPESEDPAQLLLRALNAAAAASAQTQSQQTSATTSPVQLHSTAPLSTSASSTGRPPLFPSASAPASSFTFTPPLSTSTTSTSINATTSADTSVESSTASTTAAATAAAVVQGNKRSSSRKTSVIGVKRRADASELLPLDAPIQARSYKTPSATSRKELSSSSSRTSKDAGEAPTSAADAESAPADANPAEPTGADHLNPLEAKRLSNTLAARRSRHRKAEELRILHETIASLREEVSGWKRRCLRLEAERDGERGE